MAVVEDDHCSQEVIKMLKETLNYHKGDHHTFFVFGASVSFFPLSKPKASFSLKTPPLVSIW